MCSQTAAYTMALWLFFVIFSAFRSLYKQISISRKRYSNHVTTNQICIHSKLPKTPSFTESFAHTLSRASLHFSHTGECTKHNKVNSKTMQTSTLMSVSNVRSKCQALRFYAEDLFTSQMSSSNSWQQFDQKLEDFHHVWGIFHLHLSCIFFQWLMMCVGVPSQWLGEAPFTQLISLLPLLAPAERHLWLLAARVTRAVRGTLTRPHFACLS